MIGQETNTSDIKQQKRDFELLYLAVRGLEQRIYSDKQLARLPDIEPDHVHCKEWKIRKRSAARLIDYLSRKRKPLNILEIGCGNGWLAAKMAGIPQATVYAIDVNKAEVNQARRVFTKKNLQFFAGGYHEQQFGSTRFDVVVFAASIQYFPSLENVLKDVRQSLTEDGEVHIIDSKFYEAEDIGEAVLRTHEYYAHMQYPEMASYYFHHSVDDLQKLQPTVLLNPNRLTNRLLKRGPFYWVRIKNN